MFSDLRRLSMGCASSRLQPPLHHGLLCGCMGDLLWVVPEGCRGQPALSWASPELQGAAALYPEQLLSCTTLGLLSHFSLLFPCCYSAAVFPCQWCTYTFSWLSFPSRSSLLKQLELTLVCYQALQGLACRGHNCSLPDIKTLTCKPNTLVTSL